MHVTACQNPSWHSCQWWLLPDGGRWTQTTEPERDPIMGPLQTSRPAVLTLNIKFSSAWEAEWDERPPISSPSEEPLWITALSCAANLKVRKVKKRLSHRIYKRVKLCSSVLSISVRSSSPCSAWACSASSPPRWPPSWSPLPPEGWTIPPSHTLHENNLWFRHFFLFFLSFENICMF